MKDHWARVRENRPDTVEEAEYSDVKMPINKWLDKGTLYAELKEVTWPPLQSVQ